MSYIEEKYYDKIFETFEGLTSVQEELIEIFKEKSIKRSEEIAKYCSKTNKDINLILKKFYPEIKDLDKKLKIKSHLKFYFDLIDKLTDFIRNVEYFNAMDESYFETIVEFLEDKETLIDGKYKNLATQELTTFYDKKSRENLEKILEFKLNLSNKNYFTFGALEQEIKKITKLKGADFIKIFSMKTFGEEKSAKQDPRFQQLNSIIQFGYFLDFEKIREFLKNDSFEQFLEYREENLTNLYSIASELTDFLNSKNYTALDLTSSITELKIVEKPIKSSIFYKELRKYINKASKPPERPREEIEGEFNSLKEEMLRSGREFQNKELLFFSFILTSAKLLVEKENQN
ncbi:MAG: hypothetical protein BAJALOKI2v1_30089 [Promethearchaeota archaeon]|nr:MAG: hypothetical protein BAJALOKI2v1_30089 [Candidatus Lokiarchaeota archaeon]